jgi:hypothetical protein
MTCGSGFIGSNWVMSKTKSPFGSISLLHHGFFNYANSCSKNFQPANNPEKCKNPEPLSMSLASSTTHTSRTQANATAMQKKGKQSSIG